MNVHIYIQIFVKAYKVEGYCMVFQPPSVLFIPLYPKAINYQTKCPVTGLGYFHLTCWSDGPRNSQSNTSCCSWLLSRICKYLLLKPTTSFGHSTWASSWYLPKCLFPDEYRREVYSHSITRGYTSAQWRKVSHTGVLSCKYGEMQ